MRIIHYTLGFYPYRRGGLPKYATDLMLEEKRLGHQVIALYPGGVSFLHTSCFVHKDKLYNGIETYELTNPLPVSLAYGIKDIESETISKKLDLNSFNHFLDAVKPQVFHIHTLMGLPLEYLRIIHERQIRIIYTSHDYFGLCPKVNFINQDGDVCLGASAERCALCNANAKSAFYLKIRNAKWLVPLRDIVRRLKR